MRSTKPRFRTQALGSLFATIAVVGAVVVVSQPLDTLTGLQGYILRTGSSSSSSVRATRSASSRVTKGRFNILPARRVRSSRASVSRVASSRVPIKAGCGDGLITGTETCDDKNVANSDGCSAECKIETGYTCTAQPSACFSRCGDGVIASNEKCDDANGTNGDGCNDACKIEVGYICSGTPSTCIVRPYCGNGVKEGDEQCDDGNSNDFDGCTVGCKTS